jgi:Cu2+-containing amine oxidase
LSPELKRDFLNGNVKVAKKDIEELGKAGVKEKIETVEAITTYVSPKKNVKISKIEKAVPLIITDKAEKIREKVKNANDFDITIKISGRFLVSNDLVDIWKDLRGISKETHIDEFFEDSISIYQAPFLGLVKEL